MNRRNFLKTCAALMAVVSVPAVLKPKNGLLTGEIGTWEGFRFIESESMWDLTKEYGWAVPYTDRKSMLWAAAYLKREADRLVPPYGMAELRAQVGLNYGRDNALAIYWNPSPSMQLAKPERHIPPKFDVYGGYFLLERFERSEIQRLAA